MNFFILNALNPHVASVIFLLNIIENKIINALILSFLKVGLLR